MAPWIAAIAAGGAAAFLMTSLCDGRFHLLSFLVMLGPSLWFCLAGRGYRSSAASLVRTAGAVLLACQWLFFAFALRRLDCGGVVYFLMAWTGGLYVLSGFVIGIAGAIERRVNGV